MIQGVGKFGYQPATQLEGGRSYDAMQIEHMAGRTAGGISPDPSFLPSFQESLLARALPPPLTQLAMAFTSKQRAELEHQVLLTKYLVANVPIPQELLVPLGNPRPQYDRFNTKSPFFSSLSIRDMLGGSGGTPAPQQARCLRTDGKKWQCKKLVVSGQKYCEKHMHRGRHRAANKRGEGSPGPPMSANRQKDASGDSRSGSPSSQDRSKASDSQPLKEGSEEGSIKRVKLEKRDSLSSRERPGIQFGDKAAAQPRSRSPAQLQSHTSRGLAELNSRFPDPSLPIRPPVAQAGFRELYPAPHYQLPGPPGQPGPQISYPFAGLSPLEQDRIQDLLQRSIRKPGPVHEPQRGPGPPVPKFDNVGIPPLSSQVFSNGHAASFASTRINRDGTVAPDASDIAMAMLLRQERTRLDREAIQAGLDYGAMTSSYVDPREQSLRLLFEDYRTPPAMPSAQAWVQPQVSPSSPSQWQLATSGMMRDAQGSGRLPRAFSRDSVGAQHQQGFAGGHSPQQRTVQRQGSDALGRNSLQCQPSDPLTLAGSGMPHAADNLPDGLPPHLAFLAQNNTDNSSMQPIDEERGLVRTHSLVKGGSLANRHGPHRSPLSRQPSLQNDDPEKPWLAVSTGLGDWGTDRGGPLGEALRRTTSGTPIQPHEKPGERLPAGEAPNTDFGILGDQFVSEPLGLELPPQADPTVCEDQQIPNVPSMDKDFQPFSLDGETSSPTTESRGLESSGVEEIGQASVSLTAVS